MKTVTRCFGCGKPITKGVPVQVFRNAGNITVYYCGKCPESYVDC